MFTCYLLGYSGGGGGGGYGGGGGGYGGGQYGLSLESVYYMAGTLTLHP